MGIRIIGKQIRTEDYIILFNVVWNEMNNILLGTHKTQRTGYY